MTHTLLIILCTVGVLEFGAASKLRGGGEGGCEQVKHVEQMYTCSGSSVLVPFSSDDVPKFTMVTTKNYNNPAYQVESVFPVWVGFPSLFYPILYTHELL